MHLIWEAPIPAIGLVLIGWFVARWQMTERVSVAEKHAAYWRDKSGDPEPTGETILKAAVIEKPKASAPTVKEYVPEGVTVEYLRERQQGKTDLQAVRGTKQYVGKWIRLEGTVLIVRQIDETDPVSVGLEIGGWDVICRFDADDRDASALRKDDHISLEGRIYSTGHLALNLEKCALLI